MSDAGESHPMRQVAVFVGNKLISTDSVLPLLHELVADGRIGRVRLFTTDLRTFDVICRNRVLHDGIRRIGSIDFIGSRDRSRGGRLRHRLAMLVPMLRLALDFATRPTTLVHFGLLNRWPFRLLFLACRRSTFLVQQSAGGYSTAELAMDNLVRRRAANEDLPAASALVGYQPDWKPMRDPRLAGLPKFIQRTTQNLPQWSRFVAERADVYLEEEFRSSGVASGPEILSVMLGYFGKLDFLTGPTATIDLFHETIEALLEAGGGRPVFVKPHPVTSEDRLNEAMARYRGRPVLVTYLHPAVLAARSRLFVANYYSSTLHAARLFGVPTIEYTDYNELALAETKGGSMRPDVVNHFIRRDPARLRAAIGECLAAPRGPAERGAADPDLVAALAGRVRLPDAQPRPKTGGALT